MKIQQAGSHLDHMLRQTRIHHVQLSMMADVKANGLMMIAAIMLTFSAPFVVREQFRYAVIALIVFSLLTIVLATFAVMPGRFSRRKEPAPADLSAPGFNLLFFGNFAAMNYQQYEAAMEEVLNDPSKTYEVQVREIHTLGLYLAEKKYCYLRWAYLSFATGLFLSAIALGVGVILFD
jgi:ABC-type transport system involved in Fe-S cluster assembly fused permease/ATPase subunit